LDDSERLRLVYERAYSRPPTEKETQSSLAFLKRYQLSGASRQAAWQGLCRVLLSSNEFVYIE